MFRRRTFSSGNIHYRINIDKSMCPNPVDIYIDGDTYQSDFNGSYLDIYRNMYQSHANTFAIYLIRWK